jgi:DNA repair protein RecO (recombination protein O)
MTKTYKATGINLNGIPLGESDRLMTILTPEYGLIRAVAPGARKYKSRLRGRSELFVINDLLLVKGRSLDKITQAETQESYPKLSRDLGKLTISQYLAELVLYLALSEQPQVELYSLFNEHLSRIEKLNSPENLFPYLAQAIFHILIIAGIAPQVHNCCLTQKLLIANFDNPHWQVGFSFQAGGFMILSGGNSNNKINNRLTALELTLFQHLSSKTLPDYSKMLPQTINDLSIKNAWIRIEKILKNYVEFQIGRSLKTATIINEILSKT